MKRIIRLFALVLLVSPFVVKAVVTENTQTSNWELASNEAAPTLCMQEEDLNSTNLQNSTRGYYLYCVSISCISEKNVHTIANPFSTKVKCANGNTNPYANLVASGASGIELAKGSSCSETGIYAYATEKIYYNCDQTSSGGDFQTSTTTTTATTPTTTQNNTVNNPQTGIEDYIIPLMVGVIGLSGTLYLLNKKNIFKKI